MWNLFSSKKTFIFIFLSLTLSLSLSLSICVSVFTLWRHQLNCLVTVTIATTLWWNSLFISDWWRHKGRKTTQKNRQKSIFLSWWILTVLFLCCFFRFFLVFFCFSWKFSFIFCMQFLSEQILSKKSYFNLENILFVAFYVANSNQHQHIVNNRNKKKKYLSLLLATRSSYF